VAVVNGVVNMEFAVSYRGGAWVGPVFPLTESFGVTGPDTLPCLPLCSRIAHWIEPTNRLIREPHVPDAQVATIRWRCQTER